MRNFLLSLIVTVLASAWASAQTPVPPTPSPEPAAPSAPVDKPSTDASPAGKWTMTVEVESPDNRSALDLKVDGKAVTGTSVATTGSYALTGEWAEGRLTFTMSYQNLALVFTGTLKADGTLAGTMDYGLGPMNWKAERVKEK
jgi:hypothetical protein